MNWIERLLAAIADLITRAKGLDDIHDDLGAVLTDLENATDSLSFEGVVSSIASAPSINCSDLIGYGDDFFKNYLVWVNWDAGAAGAEPQGKPPKLCTSYTSTTGLFAIEAFDTAVAVGDHVLVMHPFVYQAMVNAGKIDAEQILHTVIRTEDEYALKNANLDVSEVDAIGGTCRNIIFEVYLELDVAATYTPTISKTDELNPATFTAQLIPALAAIGTPGANGRYRYEAGDLQEGHRCRFNIAQDNAGDANHDIAVVTTYEQ